MMGDQSGPSPDAVAELALWDSLFDVETHGGRLSLTQAMPWWQREGPLRFLPNFEVDASAMFLNRFGELSWMLHRLVPALQPPDAHLPDRWKHKWQILDDCFDYYETGLSTQAGKKIGLVMVDL